MVSILRQLLVNWSTEKNQRLKMQQAYFVLVMVLAFGAGIITLVNISLGRSIVMIAALVGLVYVVNALSWMIFDMIVSRKIDQKLKARPAKKR